MPPPSKRNSNDLVKIQLDSYTRMSHVIRNYNKDSANRKTKQYFETKLANLKIQYQEFRDIHKQVVQSDSEENDDYFTEEIAETFEDKYVEAYSHLLGEFETLFPPAIPVTPITQPSDQITNVNQQNNSIIRLPTIPLPKFSGKYTDWPSFHDSFRRLVHVNRNLANIEKFHHLKAALPAEFDSDIRDIALTDGNYPTAYNLLITRYNNKRVLFTHYMNMLSNQPYISTENASKIKQLLDTSRSCVQALAQLEIPVDQCSHILVHFLIMKLPKETHQFWEQELGNSVEIPDFKRFNDFLEIRFRTLEAIEFKVNMSQSNTSTAESNYDSSKQISQQGNNRSSNRHKNSKAVNATVSNENSKTIKCVLCSDSHVIRHCPKFLSMDCFERKSTADRFKLCSNCLSNSHFVSKCSSVKNCQQCGKRHHSLLHFPNNTMSTTNRSNDHSISIPSPTTATTNISANHMEGVSQIVPFRRRDTVSFREVLLPTVVLKVHTTDGRIVILRALLDQGSQGALITERAAQSLNLHRIPMHASFTLPNGNHTRIKQAVSLVIQSCIDDQAKLEVIACIVKKTTNDLPTKSINFYDWPHINGLPLADPYFNRSREIDLLLGADVLARILLPGFVKGKPDEPIAQQTTFGWIVSGEIVEPNVHIRQFNCAHTTMELETLVQKFYEIESVSDEQIYSPEEKWCEDYFQQTHVRQANGKYMVRLPLKTLFDSTQIIGKSKQMAMNRFHSLERKFKLQPGLEKQYSDSIREYFQLNQIQPVHTVESQHVQHSQSQIPSYTCYTLPHHSVMKPSSTTTKCRVVFDASSKSSNGKSLNDILCIGPRLQNDLTAILINWRMFKYAFTCDMEKMYRCIDVFESDSHYQRILWRNESNDIQEYRLTTVTFGTASAPYTAIRVLHQLADDEKENYKLAAPILKNEIYMDDVFTGGETIELALKLRDELIGILKSAGLLLRKWASNDEQVLETIPIEHRTINPSLQIAGDSSVKTLGIHWNPTFDHFHYEINCEVESECITKRKVLSTIAKIFDPMGLIGPVIVKAKIFMKKLWSLNGGWDEALPDDLATEWLQFVAELGDLKKIQIPRWIHFISSSIVRCELHAFCDGSKQAYASAVYLRLQTEDQCFHSNIIVSKNKVTPTKAALCIPRIELCAALLNVRLVKWVLNNIKMNKLNLQIYYWSDATIVLSWIRGDINRWPVFVANRINKIHAVSNKDEWHHISTEENPADCLSRGISPVQLAEHELYFHGPKWLLRKQTYWPRSQWSFLEEEETTTINQQINATVRFNAEYSHIHRFSSYTKLCRVTAYALRFVYNKFKLNKPIYGFLTADEINRAIMFLARITQLECFVSEISALQAKKQIHTKSKLIGIAPFLDETKILRVYGRLKNAPLSYDRKHPIILPNSHQFTKLLINFAHLSTLHGGPTLTISFLRKRFWVIHARKTVQLQLKKCTICFRHRPITQTQLMGNLPVQRITPSRPFTATGIDYTGAIELRASRYRGNTTYKGYIAIFICLSTKAVHIEAVTGMDTNSFLQALQRFIGRRGLCSDIYSDCGTNFLGADKVLQKNTKSFMKTFEDDVVAKLSMNGIKWHFNPPHSPNFGGLWEANVKSIKYHLHRITNASRLTYEELSTILVRIESCLNSRPLCALSADPEDMVALTPGHFLIGDALLAPPEPIIDDISPHNRYLLIQRMYQQFWKHWSIDWLSHLQSRPKWNSPTTNLKLNDMVLIRDDRLPPNKWLLGRIVEVHPGDDGLVRVVVIKTKNGNYKRSVSKVCRLPIDNESGEGTQI